MADDPIFPGEEREPESAITGPAFDSCNMQRILSAGSQENGHQDMVSCYLGDDHLDNDYLDGLNNFTAEDMWSDLNPPSSDNTLQAVNSINQSQSASTAMPDQLPQINPSSFQSDQLGAGDPYQARNYMSSSVQPQLMSDNRPMMTAWPHPEVLHQPPCLVGAGLERPLYAQHKNACETVPPHLHRHYVEDSSSLTSSDSGHQSGESCESSPFPSPCTPGFNPFRKARSDLRADHDWEKELREHREKRRNEILERAFEKLKLKLPDSITVTFPGGIDGMGHLDILRSALDYIHLLQAMYLELKPYQDTEGSVSDNRSVGSNCVFETSLMNRQITLDMLVPEC